MNFAKNTICLQCDANRPKRQLLPGEWECSQYVLYLPFLINLLSSADMSILLISEQYVELIRKWCLFLLNLFKHHNDRCLGLGLNLVGVAV